MLLSELLPLPLPVHAAQVRIYIAVCFLHKIYLEHVKKVKYVRKKPSKFSRGLVFSTKIW